MTIKSFLAAWSLTIFTIAMVPAIAQEGQEQEKPLTIVEGSHLTVSIKLGYANLLVNSEKLKTTPGGLGMGVELCYTHFVSDHIGFHLGCDLSMYMSKYTMASYTLQSSEPVQVWTNIERGESMTVDADYRTTTENIVSDYTLTSVGIPVGLAFQGEHWYAVAGAKFNIPLKLRETSTYGKTETECVSIGNNAVSIPAEGAGVQHIEAVPYDCSARGNTFKPFFVTSLLEAGYRVGRERGDALGIGAYVEFGFNECHPENSEPLVSRQDGKIVANPTLRSNAVQSLRMMNVGVKLQYDFSFRRPKKR